MNKRVIELAALAAVSWQLAAQEVMPWKREELFAVPKLYPAPQLATNGVRAVFYEGVAYQGRPTRVFAYLSLPEGASERQRVPAMVLVHGGGGSAFHSWVKMWNERGYAAISMDTCGCVSGGGYRNHPRHEHGGPAGWGDFDSIDKPVQEQWSYHAVAAVVRAHSLIRSLKEVDAARTGITGISWGGYLTCIAAPVDGRFRCAVPVYGCGFLGHNSGWKGKLDAMGERGVRWLALWDPSVYLPRARMPFLWVSGTNDFAYPMDSLRMCVELLQAPVSLCIRPRMKHGQWDGAKPAEIFAFADHFLKDAQALPAVTEVVRSGLDVRVAYDARGRTVARAVLNYTCGTGVWKEREWQELLAVLLPEQSRVEARIPDCAAAWFVNLVTDDGMVVSTAHGDLH
jgi:dienelactone hydrolase